MIKTTLRFKNYEERDKFYARIHEEGFKSLQEWFDKKRIILAGGYGSSR